MRSKVDGQARKRGGPPRMELTAAELDRVEELKELAHQADAYCATLHGRKTKEVLMLAKAAAAGVGRVGFQSVNVQEIAI